MLYRLLPFRIRCMAHAYNLLGSVDTEITARTADTPEKKKYRLVSRAFLAKVQYIWNQQGWSDQKAELIEEIVGCRFKKPNDTRSVFVLFAFPPFQG